MNKVDDIKAKIEELQKQLQIAEAEESIPQKQRDIDFRQVINRAEHALGVVLMTKKSPKDLEHYIFEDVMIAIYGSNFFPWWNKHNLG